MHITIDTCMYDIKNSRVRVMGDDASGLWDSTCGGPKLNIKGHLVSRLRFREDSFRGRERCLAFRECGNQDAVSFLLLVGY